MALDNSSSFQVNTEAVHALTQILQDSGLTEIEYSHGGTTIRVSKAAAPMLIQGQASATNPHPTPSAPDMSSKPPGHMLTSPMVGTVYLAPKPGADPFVRLGDQVKEGQIVLIVEAMKVMNPLKAPVSGRITHIFAKDACPVEFGEELLCIAPS